MLKRTATALILAPLFILAVWYCPSPWFAVVIGVVALFGAWEWAALCGLGATARVVYVMDLVAVMLLVYWAAPRLQGIPLAVGVIGWLLIAVLLLRATNTGVISGISWWRALSGVVVLVIAWYSLFYLHQSMVIQVLLFFLLVWIADTGAYLGGRAWGRHRLAPRLSPGKTVEGLLAGMAGVMVFAVVTGVFYPELTGMGVAMWLMLCSVTVLFSVVGDLFESQLKRRAGVKDSGTLVPGHGGVLDRIDSITAAAPVFTAGVTYLTWK